MVFSESELNKLHETTELYQKTKLLIIRAEEFDKDDKTKIGAFDELRHAFDHIMRVFSLKFDLRNDIKNPEQYSSENLGKLYAHVFRAGYDALDWLNISYFKKISNLLKKYHREDIRDAIPDYYSKIQMNLIEIKKKIVEYRSQKDVGTLEKNVFNGYIEKIQELDEYYEEIIAKQEQLISIKRKRIKETILGIPFLVGTLIGIISISISIFIYINSCNI